MEGRGERGEGEVGKDFTTDEKEMFEKALHKKSVIITRHSNAISEYRSCVL